MQSSSSSLSSCTRTGEASLRKLKTPTPTSGRAPEAQLLASFLPSFPPSSSSSSILHRSAVWAASAHRRGSSLSSSFSFFLASSRHVERERGGREREKEMLAKGRQFVSASEIESERHEAVREGD